MPRPTPLFLAAALALGACSATSVHTFSRPGASVATVSRAETACRVEANQLFPAANYPVVYPYGGYYGGTWGTGWGFGATIQANDVNAPMRAQHMRDCMALKGYRPVTHPVCTSDQLAGRSYRPVSTIPAAPAQNICALRTTDGGTTLIDLSKPL